ncbi:MAG: hypothetical protein K6T35_10335, partial [Meiothermus silvanus]|nr:hypothetical protein [Allomeiothermus silvanus]
AYALPREQPPPSRPLHGAPWNNQPDLDEPIREQLSRHAEIVEEAACCLEAVVHAVEEKQIQDLQRHLEQEWDALPPRKGRGRNPRKI